MKNTVEEMTHEFTVPEHNKVSLYRQPGGCLEIKQDNEGEKEIDIVHICSDQVSAFSVELLAVYAEFVDRTNPK